MVPTLRRLRQGNYKFESSLDPSVQFYLKKEQMGRKKGSIPLSITQ